MVAINRDGGGRILGKNRRKTKHLTTENETSALGCANPVPIPPLQLLGRGHGSAKAQQQGWGYKSLKIPINPKAVRFPCGKHGEGAALCNPGDVPVRIPGSDPLWITSPSNKAIKLFFPYFLSTALKSQPEQGGRYHQRFFPGN